MLKNSTYLSHFLPSLIIACLFIPLSYSNTFNGLKNNLRLSIDVSSRMVDYQTKDQVGHTHIVGLDVHKVFSDSQGDVGTLVFQGYMTQLDNQVEHPGFFENENDSRLVYRIVTFNFTKTQYWQPNIKVGHLEIPYGLEHSINTNGTLKGYGQGSNIGIKADWGVSLNKQHQQFEYEISTTTGGNQSVESQGGSYVYSARIGTPRHHNQVVGVSAYDSKIANNTRSRLAFDIQHYWGLFALYGQLDIGDTNQQDIRRFLGEFNWRDSHELTQIYFQSHYTQQDQATQQTQHHYVIGAQLDYRQQWDISTQFQWDQQVFDNHQKNKKLSFQLRYRFSN